MKKLMTIALLLVGMTAQAQLIEKNEAGDYEQKVVVQVDGVTAGELYERTLMILSDMKGPQGRINANIDYKNKESGTIIYKGDVEVDYTKGFFGHGWEHYANTTIKVKCKDGRAQITLTIPSVTTTAVRQSGSMTRTITEIEQRILEKKGKVRKNNIAILKGVQETGKLLTTYLSEKLKQAPQDDDF